MFDLLLRNCALPDGRKAVGVGVKAGYIVALQRDLLGAALQEIDCAGMLLSPSFVDAHFHMDSSLTYGIPRVNQSGTLLEGIALWGEVKPTLTQDAIVERALAYCDWAVAKGLLSIRSHVDVCDDRLLAVEALLHVRKLVKPYLDLQLVAFPQDGLLRYPNALRNLQLALDMGVDVVGGIPHYERSSEQGFESVRLLCELAAERGLRVDMHCDESDDPQSRYVEMLALQAHRLGLHGRVVGSHLTSLHSMDNYYASKLMALLAESGVAAIANPLINITLQGRFDTYPRRRGMTRVPELLAAGVPVAFGQDCVMDPWYAGGSGDMLEVAHMGLHVAQMTSHSAILQCYEAVTSIPAHILGIEDYGLEVGCRADLVLLQADDPIEAIRLRATRLLVIREGKVIASTPSVNTTLDLPGRPLVIDSRYSSLQINHGEHKFCALGSEGSPFRQS